MLFLIKHLLYLITFLIIFSTTRVQTQNVGESSCGNKVNCHECIQTKNCAWCMLPEFGDQPRCFHPSVFAPGICPEEFTFNPDNEEARIMSRELTRVGSGGGVLVRKGSSYEANSSYQHSSFGDASELWSRRSSYGASSVQGGVVQISPQRVGLKLRVGEEHRLNFLYSQAEDYPVDLYYLMDLSNSENDKEMLLALGDQLASIRNITNNFRLGVGSFNNKAFISTRQNETEQCTGCAAAFGYQNIMSLTSTRKFSDAVSAVVFGNFDKPKSGSYALMQAIVCRDQIGWRNNARRILVFASSSDFNYGNLEEEGVIASNNVNCHLDSSGTYTPSTHQEYPSISQINKKVTDNYVTVIFTTTAQQKEVYRKLSTQIEGSSTATLSSDSSNVVELVKEEYNKISSSVEMKDNATGSVKITYYSAYLTGGKAIQTNKCDNLKVGQVVSFVAQIVVTSCPANPNDWHQIIQIYPVGTVDSLIVDLEMLCQCPCETASSLDYEEKSPKCYAHGTYKCGICECENDYFGKNCECSAISSDLDMGCRANNNSTEIDCSGRGNCVCGACECEKRQVAYEIIYGKFCECDNFSCDRHNRLLCSGPEHGTCECGECVCKPGWGGSACDCRSSNDTCIQPGSNELCSGHGDCICGKCECKKPEEGARYTGAYCENCPTCAGRCEELKDCVQCQMYKTGPLVKGEGENSCANCTLFVPIGVEKIEVIEEIGEHLCSFFDEDDCRYQFTYTDKEDKLEVRSEQDRYCPSKVFML